MERIFFCKNLSEHIDCKWSCGHLSSLQLAVACPMKLCQSWTGSWCWDLEGSLMCPGNSTLVTCTCSCHRQRLEVSRSLGDDCSQTSCWLMATVSTLMTDERVSVARIFFKHICVRMSSYCNLPAIVVPLEWLDGSQMIWYLPQEGCYCHLDHMYIQMPRCYLFLIT